MTTKSTNDWDVWQNHVLAELERLNASLIKLEDSNSTDHEDIKATIGNIRTEITVLKIKASWWGAIAGAIPGVGFLLVLLALKFLGG